MNTDDKKVLSDALSASLYLAGLLEHQSPRSLGFLPDGIVPSNIPGQKIPLFIREREGAFILSTTTLPGRTPVLLPEVVFEQPALAAQIALLPVRSHLECRFIAIDTPVTPRGERGFFPTLMLVMDGTTGLVNLTKISAYDESTTPDTTVTDFATKILAAGYRPSVIYVQDSFTEALLRDFCAKTGISFQRVSRFKHLSEAWESLSYGMRQGHLC